MIPPAPAPVESLYQRAPSLTPEVLREEIQRLTADQLDQLVLEMDKARNIPGIFRNALVRNAIDERIALADATREQWKELQRLIETGLQPVPLTPPPVPLPFRSAPPSFPPPQFAPPSSRRITGETGLKEWTGDHKGMIVATAGLAILGFFAIRYWAQKRAERATEAQEEAAAIAEGREPPKPKSWLWKLLIPSIAVGGGAIAIEAYKNRKKIAEKAKEAKQKVDASAEAQEGIENARYGLVSTGLLLLDRDLMPESTRISDAQRRHILTGFLEDQRVQNVPVSQVLSIDSESDVANVFGDVIANRPADDRRVLFFLAQSCKKHQEYVTDKARRLGLSDEEIMQMPLIEYVDQLAEVSSTFGQLTDDIATKLANKDIDIGNIDWKNIFSGPQFIHNLKTDRVFMRRIIEHYPELQTKENDFMLFCAANGSKTMHNLPEQLRQNIPDEKKQEWQMFQGILERMHQYIQDQTEYLMQYTHGEERFAGPLKNYLQNYLTVLDTVQLYYYMQQMVGRDGNFLALKESPHFTSFLLQTKIISMVKKADVGQGKRMFVNLAARGTGAALGAATNIELPEKAKELLQSAAGTITDAAHKMLTEAVDKVKIMYQETVRTAPVAAGTASAVGFYLLQTKLKNVIDSYDAKWIARSEPAKIARRFGISLEGADRIQRTVPGRLIGKTGLQNYTSPGYETNIMHGILKDIEKEQDIANVLLTKGGIGKHFDDLQSQLRTHGGTLEGQLKGATNRAQTKQIMRTFNATNQKIIDDTLDKIAPQISQKGATTFAELAEHEPRLAEAIGRGLKQKNFVTAFGHKVNIFKRNIGTAMEGTRSRTKMFAPLLVLRALTSEEKIPLANLAGSTAIQLTPIAGTLYDLDALIAGRDRITGEEISRWQSAGFVAIGAATDTITVLGAIFGFGAGGGIGVVARTAAFGTRAGVKAVKATKTAVKASEAMAKATRVALKAEKIATVARFARVGGYTFTIGNISYGLFSSDGQTPPEDSENVIA
ncbi:hypothetical protein HYZ98_05110 [Candidatus Peregrinibacteria bacterium]|nr:hypothetical protein [Candidatus Peregrinibacteria bacterium]